MLMKKPLESRLFLVGFDCFVCLWSEPMISSHFEWLPFSLCLITRQWPNKTNFKATWCCEWEKKRIGLSRLLLCITRTHHWPSSWHYLRRQSLPKMAPVLRCLGNTCRLLYLLVTFFPLCTVHVHSRKIWRSSSPLLACSCRNGLEFLQKVPHSCHRPSSPGMELHALETDSLYKKNRVFCKDPHFSYFLFCSPSPEM